MIHILQTANDKNHQSSGNRSLASIWEGFLQQVKVKPSTISTYQQAKKRFLEFFNPKTPASKLAVETCKLFREHLYKQQLAEATITGTIARTRTVFNWAVKQGLLNRNPFNEVKRGSFVNKDREHFVTRADYAKLLDACPD
ncbi:MAG: tyrosine-type recombinase/integrase [Thermoguttaceae bacterium]